MTGRLALLIVLMSAPMSVAAAASFDCATARSPVEQAICADPKLSAADDQVAVAYRTALARLGESAGIAKNAQRQWLHDLPGALKGGGAAALLNAYDLQLQTLTAIPEFPSAAQPAAGPSIRPNSTIDGYDLTLRLLRACAADASDCEVPGQLLLRAKDPKDGTQILNLPMVRAECESGDACSFESAVTVADFNFDGHPDIAIDNDVAGGYGSYGANIFLFDPAQGRFVYSDGLSTLTASLTFDLDTKHKLIRTGSKSGCCYHLDTVYRIENNRPVPVSRHIEDASGNSDKAKITDSRWVNGRWVDKVHFE